MWRFTFGAGEGLPAGYLRRSPDRLIDTHILELAPEIEGDARETRRLLRASLPWTYFEPYAPPIDSLFGLNIALDDPGFEDTPALIPDPALFRPGLDRRRYVPVTLTLGLDSGRRFHGRVDDSVVGRNPVEFDIAIWSPVAERGGVVTEILDRYGKSLISSGGKGGAIELSPGLNLITRQADLSALPVDDYLLTTRALFPDGEKLVWETSLLRMDGDWIAETRERIGALDALDRPTFEHRLDLIETHMETRDPRSSPTALGVSITEVANMLRQAEKTGYIFPPGGSVLTVCAETGSGPVFAMAYLSEGWTGDPDGCVLVLPPWDGGAEDTWPRELLAAHDRRSDDDDLAILRPLLSGSGRRARVFADCLDWAAARLPGLRIRVPALDDDPDLPRDRFTRDGGADIGLLDLETAPAKGSARAGFVLDALRRR